DIAGRSQADEVGVVDMLARPVPHEPEPRKGPIDHLAILGWVAGEQSIISVRVIANERAVDDRDPPDGLADDGKCPRPVPGLGPQQPPGRVAHRGYGPFECAASGGPVAGVLAVPGNAAAR